MSTLRTAGLLTAATALVLSTTPSAQAAGEDYVALGDSYSAGTGTRAKVDGCYRSQYGYPALLAKRYGYALSYQACSGATTAGVRDGQLGALSASTDLVTMTIGGNDVGFTSVLLECGKPGWMSNCGAAVQSGTSVMRNQLPGRYDDLFGRIKTKAPNARVSVGGYPHIFNGEDCNALTFFSPAEEGSINGATTELDGLIRTKAGAHGFRYVDPIGAFKGHAVCDDAEWINGLSNPVEESYHPNRAGNEGFANLFAPTLARGTFRAPTTRPTPRTADQLPAAKRVRAQADQVIRMKLSAPANLRKAKAAGLNPSEIRRLDARLHSSDTTVVRQALERLQTLDRRSSTPVE
jgi:lysophospholipase L1-like esterase